MHPVSLLVPKEYLPLGRKPAIQLIVEELQRAGIKRFIFVVSPEKTDLQNLFGDAHDRRAGFDQMEIEYVVQEQQLGLGHAVLCAEEAVGNSPFAVALGDCLVGLPTQSDFVANLIACCPSPEGIAIGFEQIPAETTERYAVADTDSNETPFELTGLIEKPKLGTAPSNLAVCGRNVFATSLFEELRKISFDAKQEIQLTDAINSLIRRGTPAIGVRLEPGIKRYDIGNLESYAAAFVAFAMRDRSLRLAIREVCDQEYETNR